MNDYRFQFLKNQKFTCPNCQRPKEFVRVIDLETGNLLPENVGKCERINSCKYEFTYADFLKDNPEYLENYTIQYNHTTQQPIKPVQTKAKATDYLPLELLNSLNLEKNNLFRFFCSTFGDAKSREVFERYRIGTSKHWFNDKGYSTVFPQIAIDGNLRQLKVMAYNPETGKRLHKDHPAQYWNGTEYVTYPDQSKVWFAGKTLLKNSEANLQQCFFGEHLLNGGCKVGLVESEKTAMIASLYFPELIWIATGGAHGAKWSQSNVFSALNGKVVRLFPDANMYQEWVGKAAKFRASGINISVSDLIETKATDKERAQGLDIADFLLRNKIIEPKVKDAPEEEEEEEVDVKETDGQLNNIGELLAYIQSIGMNKNRIIINI